MKRDTMWLLIGIGALLLLGGGGVAVYTMTRGLRNNNPGNIRYDGTAWEGMANPPYDDAGFVVFSDSSYGIRAMARILSNYFARGVNTVTSIISTWAPPTENDTASYIADVAGQLGVDPNTTLDPNSTLAGLVAAITGHENGVQPYSDVQIQAGIALA